MTKGQMLSNMIKLAVDYHNGQFDKGGKPYILHCLAVMHKLRTDDEELQCIAIGHDLVEDTAVDSHILRRHGMSERVINGIYALTKMSDEDPDAYLANILANPDAIRVKMADLQHNSDIRRLKGVTDKDIARMTKYHKMFMKLKEASKVHE